MLHPSQPLEVARCHGCGLCALVCPVYQQGGSVMVTPHGIAKVKQSGGKLNCDDVMACTLCGACAPICPQDINLMQLLVAVRMEASQQTAVERLETPPANSWGQAVFIADPVLLAQPETLDKVMRCLGNKVTLAEDSGVDISRAMQDGQPVTHARWHQFLTSLQSATQIIISNGLLYQLLQEELPQIPMRSLGQLLSSRDDVKRQLSVHDLYVMDTQTYHANYDEAVLHYDHLHKSCGCQLARDLHRLAVSIGAQAVNGFDHKQQIDWITKGIEVKRFIAESVADVEMLAKHSDVPTVHVVELASL